ncbi:MAG: Uma2 family endonuclease [Anaerolineae bacterium]|nr:Uma2 family endonuclease [Anaerolineae bacterium]
MAVQEQLYTLEEYRKIALLPENEDKRLEWESGVIVDMGSSSRLNAVIAARIIYFLNLHVIPNDLGYVTGPDAGFLLNPVGRVRLPDAAFISKARGVDLMGVEFDVAPDLAVEVVSPDEDVFRKVKEYIRSGTRMVLAVYGQEKVVDVFTPTLEGEYRVQELTLEDTFDGGEVLPGFKLRLTDIFPA